MSGERLCDATVPRSAQPCEHTARRALSIYASCVLLTRPFCRPSPLAGATATVIAPRVPSAPPQGVTVSLPRSAAPGQTAGGHQSQAALAGTAGVDFQSAVAAAQAIAARLAAQQPAAAAPYQPAPPYQQPQQQQQPYGGQQPPYGGAGKISGSAAPWHAAPQAQAQPYGYGAPPGQPGYQQPPAGGHGSSYDAPGAPLARVSAFKLEVEGAKRKRVLGCVPGMCAFVLWGRNAKADV